MADWYNIHLKLLQGRLEEVAGELTRIHSSPIHTGCWAPPVNVYRCADCVIVCADLAGVDRARIEVRVEARRVTIYGQRESPDIAVGSLPVQILALEIDEGPFEREVSLPLDVDPQSIRAEQKNGLLWIYLRITQP